MTDKKTSEPLIEVEEGNEDISLEAPFDPNDITVNIVPRTIGQLVDMLQYDEILVPKFQRVPNLWDKKKKSRFIESLMLNLPIPLFYFDEGDDKKWRVIDGLQRISTLEEFIVSDTKKGATLSGTKEPSRLEKLEFRTEYNGKTWQELPREVQRRILTNQVTINLIGKGTPDQVKYNIFSRINIGGIELQPQEIRTALFQGYKIDFIEKMVSPDTDAGRLFLEATDNSVPTKRQENLDFATRFVSFHLINYNRYEPDMDSFLTLGTKAIPADPKMQDKIVAAFKNSMRLVIEVFGTDAFRKRTSSDDRRKPINKSLFEIISVTFAGLTTAERKILSTKRTKFINKFIALQNQEKFWASISTGTASRERVKQRHDDFQALISQFIK